MKRILLAVLGALAFGLGQAQGQPARARFTPIAHPGAPALDDGGGMLNQWFDVGNGAGRCRTRVWGDAEFLMWRTKGIPVNTPLVTQATNFPTDPTSGLLNSPNTQILIGDQQYSLGRRYGGRLTLGGWLTDDQRLGLEGTYFYIPRRSLSQRVSSDGNPGSPILKVPFFNVVTGLEDALSLAQPVTVPVRDKLIVVPVAGSATLNLSNLLQGGELNGIVRVIRRDNLTVDGLLGFRYLYFSESLDFSLANSATLPPIGNFPARTFNFSSLDTFHATNNFYGGQLGLRGEMRMGRFVLAATGKVALGSIQQTIDINGRSSQTTSPVLASNFTNAPGGVFAQPSNSGHHTTSEFCVIPEARLKLGYDLTNNIQIFVGCDYLYVSSVARPGTMIDRNLNPTQIPAISGFPNAPTGTPAPNFTFNHSNFSAYGLNVGMQIKY